MKLVLISDTHGRHWHLTSNASFPNALPDGDLLIHAGDISDVGGKGQVTDFVEWCIKVAPRFTNGVVFIAGNHDRSFDPKFGEYSIHDELGASSKRRPIWLESILSDLTLSDYGVRYLENDSVEIEGLKIWGSPITPWFHGDRWAFNRHRGKEISEVWNTIPEDTDILITHGPPHSKGDYVMRTSEFVGCKDLDFHIKRVKPLINVYGHIHQGHGHYWEDDVHFFNASICDERYEPVQMPWVVEVDKSTKRVEVIE